MFQIHRDTRFSKDKTPYKTAATAWFAPRGFDRTHRHVEDLRRTSDVASHSFDESDATADDFLDRFVDWSGDALPLLRFVARALDVPF